MAPGFPSSKGILWVRALPLDYIDVIAGGLILAAVVISAFLWGYGKRVKKARGKPSIVPSSDQAGNESDKSEYLQVAPSKPTAALQDSYDTAPFEDACFDPERNYAQVLAEARTHLSDNCTNGHTSSETSAKDFMAMDVFCHLEHSLPAHTTSARSKSSKFWRSFLFWKRAKKAETPELGFYTSFSTPQHSSFRHPSEEGRKLRRGQSGPIYTDGLAFAPSNKSRMQKSGPIESSSESFYGMSPMQSPYHPLHKSRPCSQNRSGPLYTI